MLRFRTAINGSIGPPAHVTVPLYATPAAAAFAKKSRRSASRQANSTTASPAANTAAQFHLRLPSLPFLPACLPESLLHRRLGSSLFFFFVFYLFRPLSKSNRSILHSICSNLTRVRDKPSASQAGSQNRPPATRRWDPGFHERLLLQLFLPVFFAGNAAEFGARSIAAVVVVQHRATTTTTRAATFGKGD